MKAVKYYMKKTGIMALLLALLTACNKEEQEVEKAIHVVVNGYNGSEHEWEVAIDTTKYSQYVSNGKFIIRSASITGFEATYIYRTAQLHGQMTLTDRTTGKVVLSQPLPATGTKAYFNFIYIDGKELALNEPAPDAATNKLGFYLYGIDKNTPVDMFLYRKDGSSGKEYREYLVKNVQPGKWVYIDYVAPVNFDNKSVLRNAFIYFTKAGTTDQWAFQDSEALSKLSLFGMSFPIAGEKGLVLPYFIKYSERPLEKSRMFFHPDRVW
ncbi:hypothetical protein [Chitinophaga nivalis]|uniref:NigD-like C-terminal beta sandwich domain-containing protein n=1 Tax=Chitinophaga nivalis TaxID=2991709 RepID=A0ABT3IEU4_9BACT|nr:hypothetical protein [Chitinophaga nivalis]MCW3467837.1 hypothetical protein [Chitinophaga nivalis]MCW3482471.1 hypothetical protein [Chitinophaga nivalis]